MSEGSHGELDRCRVIIDELDRRLVQLLNDRTTVVEEIGRIKQNLTLAIYEPKREEQVYANILAHNSGPLPDQSVRRIFERIIDEMRTVQKVKMLERSSAPAGTSGETC
jgi:chorismate mutase